MGAVPGEPFCKPSGKSKQRLPSRHSLRTDSSDVGVKLNGVASTIAGCGFNGDI